MTEDKITTQRNAKEASVFENLVSLEPYERSMDAARMWLYILAAVNLFWAIFVFLSIEPEFYLSIDVIGLAATPLIFVLMALWSRKKPVIAFTLSLVFYFLLVLEYALGGNYSYYGIIIRSFIIVALVKANFDARVYERTKRMLGGGAGVKYFGLVSNRNIFSYLDGPKLLYARFYSVSQCSNTARKQPQYF